MDSKKYKTIKGFFRYEIKNIIEIVDEMEYQLNGQFDTHDFIRIFMKHYEKEYIQFLNYYPNEPFKNVNAQIEKCLFDNQKKLSIMYFGEIKTPDIFGDLKDNIWWMIMSH